jgi:hypothetical protein
MAGVTASLWGVVVLAAIAGVVAMFLACCSNRGVMGRREGR